MDNFMDPLYEEKIKHILLAGQAIEERERIQRAITLLIDLSGKEKDHDGIKPFPGYCCFPGSMR